MNKEIVLTIKDFFIYLFCMLFLSISVNLLIGEMFTRLNIELPVSRLFKFEKDQSITQIILLYCFLGPIFEELAFRLPLKFTKINLSVSVTFLTYYVCTFWGGTHLYVLNETNYLFVIFSMIIGFSTYFTLKNDEIYDFFIKIYNKPPTSLIITFYALLFAIPHISNYYLTETNKFYAFVLVIPKIISGIFYCISRLKYSVFFSFLLHMTINTIGLLVVLITS